MIIEIPDLESDTDYTYEAVATDLSDNVLTSPVLTFTTLSAPDVASPIVIGGPAVSGISQTQATVSWKTDEPAFSRVVYDSLDITLASFRSSLGEEPSTVHIRRLTGLTAATTYNFQVVSIDLAGNTSQIDGEYFETLAEPDTTPPRLTATPTITSFLSDGLTVT